MKKVSLIMPCYNSEPYLDTMLDSVVGQDYDDIELIAVDDASTDGTRAKLEAWKERFSERGFELVVLSRKENGGAAAAINEGLKVFQGKYVCFPDSDDWLYPDYTSSLVRCLEENPGYGWAKCDAEWVYEDEPNRKSVVKRNPSTSVTKNAFCDMLQGYDEHTVWIMMVRREYLEVCLPSMHLYETRSAPQEWQLQLPLSYGGDYARVGKALYRYIIRKTGWDRRATDSSWKAQKYMDDHCAAGIKTIELMSLPCEEEKRAKTVLELYCLLRKYCLTQQYAEFSTLPELYLRLGEHMRQLFGYENIGEDTLQSWFFCMVHLCCDALTGRAEDTEGESYRRLSYSIRAHGGYIVYGAGQVGYGLIPSLKAAFGAPSEVWDMAAGEGAEIFGASLVKPRFEAFPPEERADVPVIVSLLNEGVSRKIAETLKEHGYKRIFSLVQATKALRDALLQSGLLQ